MGTARILYDSAELIAASKPEGMPVIPDRSPGREDLRRVLEQETACRLFVVHRIDADTSGLVVFARTPDAHRLLSMQFEHGTASKVYLALVLGRPREDRGTIDLPLRVFGSGRVAVDIPGGKPSVTDYEVLERHESHSLLAVRPRTGRRHQIRAHLYASGHPIAGDRRYGCRSSQILLPRMMLHAFVLTVEAPGGTVLRLECPPPASFTEVLEMSRAGTLPCGGGAADDDR